MFGTSKKDLDFPDLIQSVLVPLMGGSPATIGALVAIRAVKYLYPAEFAKFEKRASALISELQFLLGSGDHVNARGFLSQEPSRRDIFDSLQKALSAPLASYEDAKTVELLAYLKNSGGFKAGAS